MANDNEMLRQALERSGKVHDVHMSSYNEVREYYRGKYGPKGWIGAYAQSITNSPTRSGKEYRAVRRSIERYETGQAKSSKYTTSVQAQKIGESLPPVRKELTGNSVTLHIKGQQGDIRGGVRTVGRRNIDVTFTGSSAYDFVNNPTWGDLWDEYDVDEDIFEDGDYEYQANSVSAS